jgi:hypothetical protein
VLGSFFGALGTVTGAAAGAVFSSVVTEVMQRSLDKTRDTVKARIKLPGGRSVDVAGKTEVPAPPVASGGESGSARVYVTPGDRPTEVMAAVPAGAGGGATAVAPAVGAPRSRRRLLVMAGFTVLVFAIGMLAITGIELVKGSPLNTSSSTSAPRPGGTSLGSVLGARSDATATSTEKATATRTKASSTAEPTAASTADGNVPPSVGRTRPAPTTSKSPRVTPTPTANPVPGGGAGATGGGVVPNAQGGGEAGTAVPQ